MPHTSARERLTARHLILPLVVVLALLIATQTTRPLETVAYDALIRSNPLPPADDLAIIAIDERSLSQLGRWPWPRTRHAELLTQLSRYDVAAVGFDILFSEPSENPADDRIFAEALRAHGRAVLPVYLFPGSHNQPLSEYLPLPQLTDAAPALGHVHVELDNDGIARGLYLHQGLGSARWPALALALRYRDGITEPPLAARIASPFVNVRSDYRAIPFAGPAGTIPTLSYVDVLEGRIPLEQLRHKVVLIGATAAGFGDVLPAPVSAQGTPLSGVEFHANVYSALRQNVGIHDVSPIARALGGIALILLIALTFPRLGPGQTFALALLLALIPCGLSAWLMAQHWLWLPPAELALIPLLAYPLWSARRLSALNQFLNRQLERLGREQGLTLHAPDQRPPGRLLDQICELLEPAGWWLSADDKPIARCALSGEDAPDERVPGLWIHRDQQSWIRLHRDGTLYLLGIQWSDKHALPACREFLHRLSLSSGLQPHPLTLPTERVAARIGQVQGAIDTLAEMRSFIGQGFERMPDGLIVTDALGVVQFVNGRITQWFGEPGPSLIGMPLLRLLRARDGDPDNDWGTLLADTLLAGRAVSAEAAVSGRALLLHLVPFKLSEFGQTGLIANVIDISPLREQERQHREAINFISHDVRSPLVSQLALIEQLKRAPGDIRVEQLDHLARLARRSYQLAEEFVQLARAEQVSPTLFYECELLAIVENAVEALTDMATAHRIRLDLDGEEDVWVRGNAELLERAVINLLSNAIQYSPSDSAVEIRVERLASSGGTLAQVSIRDHGPGIPPQELPRLFRRFHRQRLDEMQGRKGAGLGLSFVKVVTDKHGGQIDVASQPGEGSTFRLRLPVETTTGHSP